MKDFRNPMGIGELTVALKSLKRCWILPSCLNAFNQEEGGTSQLCARSSMKWRFGPKELKGWHGQPRSHLSLGPHLNSNFFLDL